MRLSRTLPGLAAGSALIVGLVATLALAVQPSTASASAAQVSPCQDGWTKGDWDLPSGSGSGHAVGKLVDGTTGVTVYKLDAKLIATPSPCLSCIQGDIAGYLDDGFGSSPDYIVKGQYSGFWFSGEGTFWAYVYELNGAGPVGKIAGKFSDPPTSSGIGEYKGEWKICP